MGIASLVLGIFSVIFCWIPGYNVLLGGITGLLGIILGAVGRIFRSKCASGGLTLSIIGFVLSIAFYAACVLFVAELAGTDVPTLFGY